MKIIAQQLLEYFKNKPKISELSERLFQLGHEHELNKGILDFEITPNRGDCLSLKGLARDLNYFYKAKIEKPIFTKKIQKLNLNFKFKIDNKVKFFFKKLLPSIFSSGVTQINILVGTIIASFQASAVSYLYYADRIYQINLALAGIAVGTVSLPVLSKAFNEKNNLLSKFKEKELF